MSDTSGVSAKGVAGKEGRLLGFFSRNPVVGALGSVASIASIALWLYDAQAGPDLSYVINPAKTAVVRTGETSRLKVQFDDQVLSRDVTAAQVAFWNAGRTPIRHDAVLTKMTIRTTKGERVLIADVKKASRSVVGIELDRAQLQGGILGVQWNILEQNDGAVIQLVFEGGEDVDLMAEAVVEGQPAITRLTIAARPTGSSGTSRLAAALPGLPIMLVALYSAVGMFSEIRNRGPRTQLGCVWPLFIVASLAAVWGLYLVLFARATAPPFGF